MYKRCKNIISLKVERRISIIISNGWLGLTHQYYELKMWYIAFFIKYTHNDIIINWYILFIYILYLRVMLYNNQLVYSLFKFYYFFNWEKTHGKGIMGIFRQMGSFLHFLVVWGP
jgi:hypothetical protein